MPLPAVVRLFFPVLSRWPPFAFDILNRTRLAFDYAIGYLYLVSCFTVLYYTGAMGWFMGVFLPWIPELGIRQGLFDLTDDGHRQWQFALKVCGAVCASRVCLVLLFVRTCTTFTCIAHHEQMGEYHGVYCKCSFPVCVCVIRDCIAHCAPVLRLSLASSDAFRYNMPCL